MPDITNALLAEKVNTLLTAWRNRELELQAWQSGTAVGGPYANGTYPITNYVGSVGYFFSPAALVASVDSPKVLAEAAQAGAEAAQAAAVAAQAAAVAARDLSLTYQTGAQAARDLAESYKNQAANSASNAAASAVASAADAAQTALDAVATAADAISTAADAAAAAASAVAAATFDPASFYTKVAADARYSLLGHTHAFADLTSKPTTLAGYGIVDAAASSHTHTTSAITDLASYTGLDVRYFTETEADARFAAIGHTHSYLPLSGGTLSSTLNGTQVSLTAAGSHLTFYESDGPDANDRMVFDLNGGLINMYGYDNSAAAWRTFFQLTVATGAATYTVDTVNSRYIQGNSGTYGTIQVGGSTNSFAGIKFLSAHQARQLMFSTSGAQWGVYSETAGAWDAYYNGGFLHTTSTLYKVPYCTWSVNADAKSAIMSRGTAAPSGGTDGDIYFQYT